jgi:hypothetical protein
MHCSIESTTHAANKVLHILRGQRNFAQQSDPSDYIINISSLTQQSTALDTDHLFRL